MLTWSDGGVSVSSIFEVDDSVTISSDRSVAAILAMLAVACGVAGCDMGGRPAGRSVGDAWEEPATPSTEGGAEWDEALPEPPGQADAGRPLPIATVNGRPISRRQMLNLLVRTHGLAVLEQLIALELVRQAAEAEGISITPADIQAEHDRAVSRISSPVPAATQPALGKDAKEALLDRMLARRRLSREEFQLSMERQAYLRKMAARHLELDDKMLRAEYDMMYAERVQIRHIQLADWREIGKIQKLLTGGVDFAEVARVHSENPRTASEGGLLPPFSRDQDDVPPQLREAAFRLKLGQVSNSIRIEGDYHLIKPVKRFAKSNVQYEHVKEIVRLKLTERLLPEVTARIERDLFAKAQSGIVITDPTLRKEFKDRYRFSRTGAAAAGR